jgi:hypothetical protein
MGWMTIFRSSGKAPWTDRRGETAINGAPCYPNQAMKNSAAAYASDAEITEEIKRRQTALLVNYVIALRALSPTANQCSGRPRPSERSVGQLPSDVGQQPIPS